MGVTVIEGCAIATVDDTRREIADGHVVCEEGRIAAVGEGPATSAPDGARRIDGRGKLASPGLVNSHHHLYQHATRGYAQQATLFEWLTALYPVWAHIDGEVVDAAARAALAALARSGCTTTTDHHYIFPRGAGDLLAVEIEAARAIGLRFHPCRGAMDLGQSRGGLPPDAIVEERDAILAASADAIDRFHDSSPGAMVRIALAPTSPFSVTTELMADTAELARARGVRLHTHLAEIPERDVGRRSGAQVAELVVATDAARPVARGQLERLPRGQRRRSARHAREQQRRAQLVDQLAALVRRGAVDAEPDRRPG